MYIILSRDVPILKSFSAGGPKIFVCCSGGCSAVAAVAELSWPIVGCQNGRRKQRIAYRTFLFQYQRQNIKTIEVTTCPSIQSVQRSHNDFLRPMKHYLAASDEIARRGSLHEFVSTILCMILWVRQSLEFTLQFSSSHLIECPSRVFVWRLESINIMEQIDEDNYFLQCSGDLSRVLGE